MKDIDTISKEDFEDYERVRAGGRYNMFDPLGRAYALYRAMGQVAGCQGGKT